MTKKPTSFAAYFMGFGFAPEGHTNALRFATETEASEYAQCLFQRWIMPTGFEVRGTADPVNYRWNRDTRQAVAINRKAMERPSHDR